MAHTGIFCTKAEIDVKVGENVDATGYTEASINASCLQAESLMNVLSKKNWSDAYAGLNADVKGILADAESSYVAVDFIAYNMAGYSDRIACEDMVNLQWAKFKMCIELLKSQDIVSWMVSA